MTEWYSDILGEATGETIWNWLLLGVKGFYLERRNITSFHAPRAHCHNLCHNEALWVRLRTCRSPLIQNVQLSISSRSFKQSAVPQKGFHYARSDIYPSQDICGFNHRRHNSRSDASCTLAIGWFLPHYISGLRSAMFVLLVYVPVVRILRRAPERFPVFSKWQTNFLDTWLRNTRLI